MVTVDLCGLRVQIVPERGDTHQHEVAAQYCARLAEIVIGP
jgi:hypothetical protein